MEAIIVGGGIAGLTLALSLHQVGVRCRIYEAAAELERLGVGINLLPHCVRVLSELGLEDRLAQHSVETSEMCYYNRFGQFIYKEPRGRFAGYDWPQFSLHRGDLQIVLLEAVRERLGPGAVTLGHKFVAVEQRQDGITVHFADPKTGAALPSVQGGVLLACDGIHSAMRRVLFPGEGAPVYQGINMWRGVTRAKPFLTGTSMVLAGWLSVGKMVIYPIDPVADDGLQVINWVAEILSPRNVMQDWNLKGRLEDIYPTYANWKFPWLDCAALVREAEIVLEYPMVDRDPLPYWSSGRVTLVGDAAHPMYPRGGNGAGQAILDAACLAQCLASDEKAEAALRRYESERLQAANKVLLTNRAIPTDRSLTPADYILKIVHDRSGDRPFRHIEDLISQEEMADLTESYKKVAGFSRDALRKPSVGRRS